MRDAEITDLICQSAGARLCVRYAQAPDGTPMTLDYQKRNRREVRTGRWLLAGLILVYMGVEGKDAVELLRGRRPGALFNQVFADYLLGLPAGGPSALT